MTTVKVDISLLNKYFSDHYDFTNDPGGYFKNVKYDLEVGLMKKSKPVYEDIQILCNKYGLESHADTFFNLFVVSRQIRFLTEHASIGKTNKRVEFKNEIQFKKDLFSLFLSVLNDNYSEINSLRVNGRKRSYEPNGTKVISSQKYEIEVTRKDDPLLLDKFRTFILDEVAVLYFNKKWDELNSDIEYKIDEQTGGRVLIDNEVTIIIDDVENWLEQFVNPENGAPQKTFFLKHFVHNIDVFLLEEINSFQSQRQRHGFIGKLLVAFHIFPLQEDNKHIKAIENLLQRVETR